MLRRIVIENINSIAACEIDFAKGNFRFAEENILGDVVNPIVIYGHNGSGKSSLMNAISHFISLMSAPAEALSPFTVNNFLFEDYHQGRKKDIAKITSSILFGFDIEGVGYEYSLKTNRLGSISEESLTKDGEIYFSRKDLDYVYRKDKKTIPASSKLVPLLRLLASSEISDGTIQLCFAYLASFAHVNVSFINRGAFVNSRVFTNTNTVDLLVEKSDQVKEILKTYEDFPVYSVIKSNRIAPNGLIAQQYDIVLEDGEFKRSLPIALASTGMLNQSTLLSLLLSMPKQGVMFIDEADAALHPKALESFLRVIREKQIQVVLTLHNTYALQLLRPDQVYFAKWTKGFSRFARLSKIYPNIREINNMEKMYLSCVFDGALDAESE